MLERKRNRPIIRLRFVDGKSVRQTARMMKVSRSTVERSEPNFKRDRQIINLADMPRDELRDLVLPMLERAEALHEPKSALRLATEADDPRRLLAVI